LLQDANLLMATVKSSLWSICNEPVPLQNVKVSGVVDDFRGTFTLVQTYVTRKDGNPQDCIFQFLLFDIGIVTGFKATVAGAPIDASCLPKISPKVSSVGQELIKSHSDPSATDALICKLDQLPPDTTVQFQINFVQHLRLDREALFFSLPTTISPKVYSHEEGDPGLSSLRQFNFDLDVTVKLRGTNITTIRSPTHPLKYISSAPNSGRIEIAKEEVSDLDIAVFIDLEYPISKTLPHGVVEQHGEREIVMLTCRPEFDCPVFEVDPDDEEGHPDPREILVAIDPHQNTFDEVKTVVKAIVKNFTEQIYLNVLILKKDKPTRMFPGRSQPGDARSIKKANDWVEGQAFIDAFKAAQEENNTLTNSLKPVFDVDCVSEEIRRTMLIVTKGQISRPSALFENIADEKGFFIFGLGLGPSANAFVVNTLCSTGVGTSEIIYSTTKAEFEQEVQEKIKKQVARINQPVFGRVVIDWGNLTKHMIEQTPSRDLPMTFYSGDLFTFFGIAEKPQRREPWRIEVKVESKGFTKDVKAPQFTVAVDPKGDSIKGSVVERLQIKRERDQPDTNQHVRLKKIYEQAAVCGVTCAATTFFGAQDVKGCSVTLVSASDSFLDELEEPQKPSVVKYDRNTLLKFQPHNTEKPNCELGEVERGKEITAGYRGGSGRGRANRGLQRKGGPVPNVRAKKLQIATQWDAGQLDEFFRSVNALLNKMSLENFDNLKTKLLAMKAQIEAEFDALGVIVKLVFEKALVSPRYAPLYADLCVVLANELTTGFVVEKDGKQTKIDFRVLILQHCRDNFQQCFTSVETTGTAEEIAEAEFKKKARLGANIAFVGELFLRNLVRPQIIHMVIRALLEEDRQGELGHPDPQHIELCCKLFGTLGTRLESEDSLAYTDKYFAHFAGLTENPKYDMRTRFMIRDMIELRKADWVQRKGGIAVSGKAVAAPPIAKAVSPPPSPGGKRVNPHHEDRPPRGRDGGPRGGDRPPRGGDRPPRGGGGSDRGGRDPRGGGPPNKNNQTGSSRVDSRSDGWTDVRGGKGGQRNDRGGNAPNYPSSPTKGPKDPRDRRGDDGPKRGGGGSSSNHSVGRGNALESKGNDGFSTRGGGRGGSSRGGGGRGGGRGGGAPKEGAMGNAFALLNEGSPASSPGPTPPSTPSKGGYDDQQSDD